MIRIRRWEDFQHYRDRNPPWIKVHKSLLNNVEWFSVSDQAARTLVMMWLVASEDEQGFLPETDTLAWRLRMPPHELTACIEELLRARFLEECERKDAPVRWPSRYVSKKVRAEIMERDDHACVWCGATDKLEIDHIVPVSRNGSGDPTNLQVLCRSCNRKKRSGAAERLAT